MPTFRILHVDDDVDCSFRLSETLRKDARFFLDWAANTLSFTKAETPDLVICEPLLVSWPQVLQDIKTAHPSIPIVVYSKSPRKTLMGYLNRGATRVFSKSSPFDYAEMIEYLKEMLTQI